MAKRLTVLGRAIAQLDDELAKNQYDRDILIQARLRLVQQQDADQKTPATKD